MSEREELMLREASVQQAIGWLAAALAVDHPGYLEMQIDRAAAGGFHTTAAGLRVIAGFAS